MSELAQVEKLLSELTTELQTSQDRLEMAKREAKTLEERNARIIADGKDKASRESGKIISIARKDEAIVNLEILRLTKVKTDLLNVISQLNEDKSAIDKEIIRLNTEEAQLEALAAEKVQKLDELDNQLVESSKDLADRSGKVEALHEDIRELQNSKQEIVEDLSILESTVNETEERVIRLDADFKSVQSDLNARLDKARYELNQTLSNLTDAQNKDKQIRENWADEHRKLDKRIEVVRRMEAKLSTSEARIQELDNYMKM